MGESEGEDREHDLAERQGLCIGDLPE